MRILGVGGCGGADRRQGRSPRHVIVGGSRAAERPWMSDWSRWRLGHAEHRRWRGGGDRLVDVMRSPGLLGNGALVCNRLGGIDEELVEAPGEVSLKAAQRSFVAPMSSEGRYLRVSEREDGEGGAAFGGAHRRLSGGAIGRCELGEGVRRAENASFGAGEVRIGRVVSFSGDSGPAGPCGPARQRVTDRVWLSGRPFR